MSLLELKSVKPHLKIESSADNTVLQAKLDAAEAYVARAAGGADALEQTSVTETKRASGTILLSQTPVVSVTSVTGDSGGSIDVSTLHLGKTSGVLEPSTGSLSDDWYTVVYEAGYATAVDLPENLAEAVRLMTQHFYATQRGPTVRPGTGGNPSGGPDAYARAQQILSDYALGSGFA